MKKMLLFPLLTVVALILTSACATVKVYSDAELKKETGLKYYPLKPYLLVEYNAEKDDRDRTTVVYLPDLEAAQYMVLRPGLGSSELKMSFKNGALESYGAVTESQLAESMEAFADILSKSAYATQTLSSGAPDDEDTVAGEGIPFRLFEILNEDGETILKEVEP